MKINPCIFVPLQALTLCAALAACDDGYIYPHAEVIQTEGRVVKMTATLDSTIGHWPSDHNLVLAGFESEDAEVASIVKNLPTNRSGEVEVVLSGIPKDVTSVALCITGRLRNRLYTLAAIPCPDTQDTIPMVLGRKDLSMLGVLKSELFDQRCAGCHATNGFFGLNLTQGSIRQGLAGQSSHGDAGQMLVQQGDSTQSLLYTILTDAQVSEQWRQKGAAEGLFGGVGYDHVGSVTSSHPALYTLLRSWIAEGAQ